MPNPSSRVYRDYGVASLPDWSVDGVKSALRDHEAGVFARSSMLVDAMGRDDRLTAVLDRRILGVLGLPFRIEKSELGDQRRAQMAANAWKDVWKTACPPETLAEILRWEIMLGLALVEILWDRSASEWRPTLKVWHPQYLYYLRDDVGERYVVQTVEGPVTVTPGDGKWVLLTPGGRRRGWMTGAVRGLAVPWLVRDFARRDWARYSEVHGMPLRRAEVPSQASDPDKQKFFASISALGAETTVECAKDENGHGFDVTFAEATDRSFQGFERLMTKQETAYAVRLLGNNLSTEVQGGSFAATTAHESVALAIIRATAMMLAPLRDQIGGPWAEYNYGARDLAPNNCWDTEPPTDKSSAAATFKTVSDAISTLEASGFEVDEKEISERFGFKVRRRREPAASATTPAPGTTATPPNGESEDTAAYAAA